MLQEVTPGGGQAASKRHHLHHTVGEGVTEDRGWGVGGL
jgi:hypothetical protein